MKVLGSQCSFFTTHIDVLFVSPWIPTSTRKMTCYQKLPLVPRLGEIWITVPWMPFRKMFGKEDVEIFVDETVTPWRIHGWDWYIYIHLPSKSSKCRHVNTFIYQIIRMVSVMRSETRAWIFVTFFESHPNGGGSWMVDSDDFLDWRIGGDDGTRRIAESEVF